MKMTLNVHTDSFKAVHIRENARLIPSQSVHMEQKMALARHQAFVSRVKSAAPGGADLKNILKIRRAFASGEPVKQAEQVPLPSLKAASVSALLPDQAAAAAVPSSPSAQSYESSYVMDRAAVEIRSLSGSLTFVPPLSLTVITQYPKVTFEYTQEPELPPA